VVPVWTASNKQEYAARTIRNKINSKLDEFLTQFPPVVKQEKKKDAKDAPKIDWKGVRETLQVDQNVEPVKSFTPGAKAGLAVLEDFAKKRGKRYNDKRNDPNEGQALSNISPYFHFGQVSPQRAALYAKKHMKGESLAAFLEESIVRRELSDNYCYYQVNYDNLKGAADWARKTLEEHAKDERPYLYSRKQFEEAKTHDDLWNAAQLQMAREGKMHGFLRMYWAKKILEWSASPAEALATAIYLNDRYELDGRDPSGYVGCMWSVCGLHGQGWAERKVFGKIRCMVYDGCRRKFDVAKFVKKYGAVAHPYKQKTLDDAVAKRRKVK